MKHLIAFLAAAFVGTSALAHEPEIVGVTVDKSGMDWRINVTILHADTGWDHYVDGWEVLDAEGNRLAYRLLRHPHVNEQPFTRSLGNLMFPDGTTEVFIRAHCSVDGWTGDTVRVALEQ